jgi:cell division protein FtsA
MDTRLGQPNEHLAGNNSVEISNPTYATAVGLVMNSLNRKKNNTKVKEEGSEKDQVNDSKKENRSTDFSKTVFEKFTDKIKNFLENAE